MMEPNIPEMTPELQDRINKRNAQFVDEVESALKELKTAIGNPDLNAVGYKIMAQVALAALRRYKDFHHTGKTEVRAGLERGAEGEGDDVTALLMATHLLKGASR